MNKPLLDAIGNALKRQKFSERKACLRAREINPDIGPDYIRNIRRGAARPDYNKLAAIAQAIGAPVTELTHFLSDKPKTTSERIPLGLVRVIGEVQAGVFRETIEWPVDEWRTISVPQFDDIARYGLLVKGDSMDKVFPEGSIVIVQRIEDYPQKIQTGDIVVVVRRASTSNEYEATLKAIQFHESDIVLWPQSTNPEYTQVKLPRIWSQSDAEAAEICIKFVVVGSYAANPRVKF